MMAFLVFALLFVIQRMVVCTFQGYASAESHIEEIEVWGFGGKASEEKQKAYLQREALFKEQRGKV